MRVKTVKRIVGKGYENRCVIVKRRMPDFLFFCFLCLFGMTVYLVSSLLFYALFAHAQSVWAYSL